MTDGLRRPWRRNWRDCRQGIDVDQSGIVRLNACFFTALTDQSAKHTPLFCDAGHMHLRAVGCIAERGERPSASWFVETGTNGRLERMDGAARCDG